VKERPAVSEAANPAKDWQKTPFANLVRYVPLGTYFARLRVGGKLIRKTLKTDVLSVAKLRLGDLEKQEFAPANFLARHLNYSFLFPRSRPCRANIHQGGITKGTVLNVRNFHDYELRNWRKTKGQRNKLDF
jgi:hypothetical protein